jgi:hypothetical protein
MTTHEFETKVRKRCLFSLNYPIAKAGSFNTLEDFQRYAAGAQSMASPKQVRALANLFRSEFRQAMGLRRDVDLFTQVRAHAVNGVGSGPAPAARA